MAKLRKARCFWPQGRRRKGGLPPLYIGGKARFPGLFVATLSQKQEGSHAGIEGEAGQRGGGGPLLLRCGLVCGNGNVRGPRAGGGDAKRHDEHCPPTLRAARLVKGEVGSSSPRCRSVPALSSLHCSSNSWLPECRRTDSTDKPWNDDSIAAGAGQGRGMTKKAGPGGSAFP